MDARRARQRLSGARQRPNEEMTVREVVVRVVHTICSSKDKASLTMMRGLKAMQDPYGILNSYKVLPSA